MFLSFSFLISKMVSVMDNLLYYTIIVNVSGFMCSKMLCLESQIVKLGEH